MKKQVVREAVLERHAPPPRPDEDAMMLHPDASLSEDSLQKVLQPAEVCDHGHSRVRFEVTSVGTMRPGHRRQQDQKK